MQNRNAYIGMNVETLFKNSIGDHPSAIRAIRTKYNLEGRFLNAIKSGIHGEKNDVKIEFACGHNIDANIKAYKRASAFNQLTRTSSSRFCEIFNINESDKEELEFLITNKAADARNNLLFPYSYQKKWRAFFENNVDDIIAWAFSYKRSREIMVLYDRDQSIFRIYPMAETLKKLNKEIVFTPKGNIKIGECVSFQRKGGNGKMSRTIPKTSIKHPGNNIQLKLRGLKFVELMEDIKLAQYLV